MSEAHTAPEDPHECGRYEIRVKGHLDTLWVERFEGLNLSHEDDGTTIFSGPVIDQAALHGLLRTVRDLGLTLVSVTQASSGTCAGPDANADGDSALTGKETKA